MLPVKVPKSPKQELEQFLHPKQGPLTCPKKVSTSCSKPAPMNCSRKAAMGRPNCWGQSLVLPHPLWALAHP